MTTSETVKEMTLAQAVGLYARVTHGVSEADLERKWAWGAYDSEGVRFAHFRTYEELRELAVKVMAGRVARGQGPSSAQRILAHYHAAQRDLEAALLGLGAADLERAPAQGEWPVRTIVAHVAEADVGFYVVVQHALEQHRAGAFQPAPIPEEVWGRLIGLEVSAFDAIMNGPFVELWRYQQAHHERVLREFAGIRDEELALPSMYWEGEPLSLRFRLHRFDSHMRQHTVQVDKALLGIGCAPSEAKRLLRLIYAALAEVEGALIGAPDADAAMCQATAQAIAARGDEIAQILRD